MYLQADISRHQKKGLDFMLQRENGPIPDDYRLWKSAEIDGLPWYGVT